MTDMAVTAVERDPYDVRQVPRATGLLRSFNEAGVLVAADIHVALRLADLASEKDDAVLLAAALAVRGPRLAHVHVDLASIRETATVETDEPVDLSVLEWPSADAWVTRVAASPLVAVGEEEDADPTRPLRLVGTWLYLDRYWREERQVAADLTALSKDESPGVLVDVLHDGLERLFTDQTDSRQCLAAASAVLRRLAVVAGGPGTGKTTTVARIVALLAEQPAATGAPLPLVALAAPTGKAAARLEESVHEEAAKLPVNVAIGDELLALQAATLHRLLGWQPGSHSRFRHDRTQRLPHDVVIVDETSMVSLSLMARLVEAIRPDARLILVGDPGQLASIEAGAVLGDIVGPASESLRIDTAARSRLTETVGHPVTAEDPPPGTTIGNGIVVLDRVHRFGAGIAQLAEAIRRGNPDDVIDVLNEAPEGVTWIPVHTADPASLEVFTPIRDGAVAAGRAVFEAAHAGAAREALEALSSFRILCAHRRGPQGVATWTARIEGWLTAAVDGFTTDTPWYLGRPLLVIENDYELRLYNGDAGVVVQTTPDRAAAAFARRGEIIEFRPTRLSAIDTVYAMTIHKSQGSQFDTAAVLLPDPTSRILTRELLYTAATRARKLLMLVGTEEAIRAAVARPVARASGLGWRMWERSEREHDPRVRPTSAVGGHVDRP